MKMYWKDPEMFSPGVKFLMKYDHFCEISRYTRLYSDAMARETGESDPKSVNYDPNYKINAVWKALILGFQRNKNPGQNMVIDETIIAFKVSFGPM